MIGRPDVAAQVALEQPQTTIIFPGAKLDRMAHEVIASIDPVAFVLRFTEHVANFGGKRGWNAFVRVENHYPFICGLRDGPVLEVARRSVLPFDDPATQFAREFERAVR